MRTLCMQRLQWVINAAVRLIFSLSRFDNISPLLSRFYWLKASERINYTVAVLAYKCQHGLAPRYLCDELRRPLLIFIFISCERISGQHFARHGELYARILHDYVYMYTTISYLGSLWATDS